MAPADERPTVFLARRRGQRRHESGLADPGVAYADSRATHPVRYVGQHRAQSGYLGAAADERGVGDGPVGGTSLGGARHWHSRASYGSRGRLACGPSTQDVLIELFGVLLGLYPELALECAHTDLVLM